MSSTNALFVARIIRRERRSDLRRLVVALVGATGVFFWLSAVAAAHDEPPKTATELTDREATRRKIQSAAIMSQKIWITEFDSTGQAMDSLFRLRNRYDRHGNVVEQVVYDASDSSRMVAFNDDQNAWLEELTFQADTLVGRDIFVYNRDGLVSHILSYDYLGTLTAALDYGYRRQDDAIVVTKRNQRDSIEYSICYQYEPGTNFKRQVEIIQTNTDGSLRTKVLNHYDGDLRAEKSVYGASGARTHTFTYRYTADGDFSEITKTTAAGIVAFRQACEYDDAGMVMKITERDGAGLVRRVLRYSYEYYPKSR